LRDRNAVKLADSGVALVQYYVLDMRQFLLAVKPLAGGALVVRAMLHKKRQDFPLGVIKRPICHCCIALSFNQPH
jgi:hypothetical protein